MTESLPIPTERMAAATRTVLADAEARARAHSRSWIGTEHLLLALLDAAGGASGRVFAETGWSPIALSDRILSILANRGPDTALRRMYTLDVLQALELSVSEADRLGHFYVEPDHLLLAVLSDGTGSAEALDQIGVMRDSARAVIFRRLWEGE